ncbi:TetR/AcrR family transcriptional regulator [Streptomyces odonnellii]|uniref:TetR/AcrR family transcriptional regulator n=1 Tax=Streptomyces odonnellii TaxID=1417980 RepID=UPI00062668A6|nr:TetR/AcrR family transcriptional regulator [Streptomyces odonnellii]
MGHREDLLEGAKRCLLEKGYARTTARDIVAASGTNLASIGYHYGSKEALLNQAFLAVTEEWGDSIDQERAGESLPEEPLERFRAVWERVIGTFEASRPLWKLQFEIISRIDQEPELKAALAGAQSEGRNGLAEAFQGQGVKDDPEKTRVVGIVYHAMLAGVMAQWLIDPETAPSAQDVTDGLRAIMGDA